MDEWQLCQSFSWALEQWWRKQSLLSWILISNHLFPFLKFFVLLFYLEIGGLVWGSLYWVCHVLWDVNINCSYQGHQQWPFEKHSWTLNLLEFNIWTLISFWFFFSSWDKGGNSYEDFEERSFYPSRRIGQSVKKQTNKRCLFYVWFLPDLWSSQAGQCSLWGSHCSNCFS